MIIHKVIVKSKGNAAGQDPCYLVLKTERFCRWKVRNCATTCELVVLSFCCSVFAGRHLHCCRLQRISAGIRILSMTSSDSVCGKNEST